MCLYTGHIAYYLGGIVKLMNAHPGRIEYRHLKQVESDICAAALKIEPGGSGVHDFAPIIEATAEIDPDMFAIVD